MYISTLFTVTIELVISPSILSDAVAPESVYAVPSSKLTSVSPDNVITGLVTSGVMLTVLVTSSAELPAASLTL